MRWGQWFLSKIFTLIKIWFGVEWLLLDDGGCGGQNGTSKGYAATRTLCLTKVINIPLKQVAN